jgi:endonuclease YncB( thermonuclease family)
MPGAGTAGSVPTAIVERVSDGDTVILRFPDGRRERTRLIGIDTPETRAGAKLDRTPSEPARTGRRSRCSAGGDGVQPPTGGGQTVEVESDVEKRDRYGRRLAYLWLPHGQMVNALIIREGYAQPLTVNVRSRRCSWPVSARRGRQGGACGGDDEAQLKPRVSSRAAVHREGRMIDSQEAR